MAMMQEGVVMSCKSGMLVFAVIFSAACGGGGDGLSPDTGPGEDSRVSWDASPDTWPDTSPDSGPDTLPDLPADLVEDLSDLLADVAPDLPPELEPELPSCDCAAPIAAVTVNGIPETMNGSQPYLGNDLQEHAFHLALPTWGFTWEVTADCPCGCDEDALEAFLATDEALPIEGLEVHFVFDGEGAWSWDVPEDLALPTPGAGLCVRVTDACGKPSTDVCLQVDLVEMTPALHPFQPPDPWVFVWRRDSRTIGLADNEDGVTVWSDPEPNGAWDFLEDLWLAGLGTAAAEATPEWTAMDCGWAQGGNECVVRAILEAVRSEAYKFYFKEPDGTCGTHCTDILFLIEGEAGAPDPANFEYQTLDGTEVTRNFSMIGFGGGDLSQSLLGLSESMDPRNDGNENNAKAGYGCLTTSLVRFIIEAMADDPSLADLAAVMFGSIMPTLGGISLGAGPEDHLVIDSAVPDADLSSAALQRRKTWDFMVDVMGFGLAALTVHEIGHSVGLVAYGAPPYGLFGSEKEAAFVESPAGCKGAHIDTAGLNLMQAGPGSGNGFVFSMDLLSEPIGFNELNSAYLKGQLLILP